MDSDMIERNENEPTKGEQCYPEKAMYPGPRRLRDVSYTRRVQLLAMAQRIAEDLMEHTKQHERCLLRRMVESLLPGEE